MQPGHLNESINKFASTDFTVLSPDVTVAEAFRQVRERGVAQQIIYFYVADAE